MTSDSLDAKFEALTRSLTALRSVAVAFSGGVDSTFVLKVAVDVLGRDNVLAVTAVSSSLAAQELEDARQLAAAMNARHLLVDPGEFDDPNYLSNPENRCYYCKSALYARMDAILAEHGLQAAVNGTNADDLGDYRPGLAAAREHSVHSPCVDAGLTKAEIRVLSERLGLPTHDKPAAPCLSSRIQYGEHITVEKLRMVERGEALLRELGFRECRVRHHDKLARIEVPPQDIERIAAADVRARIDACFRQLGYQYVALDLRGFRSGSMNEVVPLNIRARA